MAIWERNAGEGAQGRFAFDRFAIEATVGTGGMATVYRAYDTRLERHVALKVISAAEESAPHPGEILSEARLTARVNSPHAVSVYDSGIAGGQCFIVMEYVDGIDLRTASERHGKFSAGAAAQIGAQVCRALENAHGNGIVHNDIKPSNIMLTREGTAKITDFGIARARARSAEGQPTFGTLHYMSPEQAAGQAARPQCDIYALGVTLYELVCGRLPSTSFGDIRETGVTADEAPIPASLLNPSANEAMDDILESCMRHDPADRFASARRLRMRFEDYLDAYGMPDPVVIPPANPPQYWVLIPQGQEDAEMSAFKLTADTVIGRSGEAGIRIDSPIVSSFHARVVPWGACLLVSDLDSSNGTAINGMPVGAHAISYPGDIVTVGTTDFLVACKW